MRGRKGSGPGDVSHIEDTPAGTPSTRYRLGANRFERRPQSLPCRRARRVPVHAVMGRSGNPYVSYACCARHGHRHAA